MPRLRPVPDAPRRAVKIVRVSKERDDMIAPELQDAACDDYCARAGYEIVARLEGIDESGSQRRSPWWATLDEAVAMVERGDAEVIIGWKFSRHARNRMRWAVAVDRVETAGGSIESATEPVDVSTSTGRFTRGMLAELAAFEAERIGDVWKEVLARRVRQGLPADGKPRFGYRIIDGVNTPDPDTGPVLADLYRRFIAGETIYTLIVWLNGNGHRTVEGYRRGGAGPWRYATLKRVLDSGFAAGIIRAHGQEHPGVHEPLIDVETFREYERQRDARATRHPRQERSPYLFTGLLRCGWPVDGGECGARMHGRSTRRDGTVGYRCAAYVTQVRHAGGNKAAWKIEQAVQDWLREVATDVNTAADVLLAEQARAARRRTDADRLARELLAVEQALTNLTVDHARRVVPEAAYIAARDTLTAQRDRLAAAHANASAEASEGQPRRIAADLLADWDLLSVELRRAALRRLIDRVTVYPDRVQVTPAWHV